MTMSPFFCTQCQLLGKKNRKKTTNPCKFFLLRLEHPGLSPYQVLNAKVTLGWLKAPLSESALYLLWVHNMTIVKKIKAKRCCVSSKTQMKWFKISTEFTWDWPEAKSKSKCTLFLKKLKKLIGKLKIKTASDLWVKHISSWFLSHF